jgi:hypothetical protein
MRAARAATSRDAGAGRITVLRALAAVYCVLSLGPWLGKFVSLAFAAL